MKKLVIVAVVAVAVLAGLAFYTGWFNGEPAAEAAGQGGAGGRGGEGRGGGFQGGGGFPGGGFPGGGFPGGGGRGGGARAPMTVELATAKRAAVPQELLVVGNLVGDQTVAVAPRAAGRVQEVYVRLGDRVTQGQRIARIEDFELREQIKQAEAAQEVSLATIRQRDADLQLALTNVERSRNLFERQLLPKQTLDDNEARYQSAVAQLDLARAQANQSKARLDELRINMANTIVTSPMNGVIARRAVDPGASVSQNAPVVDVVDVSKVRLVVNVVEKDLSALQAGDTTRVQVDGYPGETFRGRIARVSPILDPATRTAPIEIEIPNADYRLKPGMYARVSITTGTKDNALVVPGSAVVDLGGRRGIFQPLNGSAVFRTVQVGSEQGAQTEILGGLSEGEQVITTGAGALRDGDRILIAGDTGGEDGPSGSGRGTAGAPGQPSGQSGPPPVAADVPSGISGGRQFSAPDGGAPAGGRGRRSGGEGGGRRGGQAPVN
jgi:membrane fusion protein, multidrug efflux system